VDKKTRIERQYSHQVVEDKRSSRLQGLTWKPENKRDGRNCSEYGFYRDRQINAVSNHSCILVLLLHPTITKFAGSLFLVLVALRNRLRVGLSSR
jgi:hypothetical protein